MKLLLITVMSVACGSGLAVGAATGNAVEPGGAAAAVSAPTSSSSPETADATSEPVSAGTSGPGGPGAPPDAHFGLADAIRERVFVTNGRDDDDDGRPDRLTIDIVRPNSDEPVPVILVQSPYWDNAGRGREGETKRRDANGVVVSMPLFYDNWFVPRGYAFVALDVPGLGSAGGCDDNFGPASIGAATAALDWLAGTGPAFDDAGAQVAATWSDGNVAMIGKSADGGLAVSAAATGHPALKAIVSIEGVTGSLERGTSGGLLSGPVPLPEWYELEPECHDFAESYIEAWGDGYTYTEFWRDRDPTADMSRYSAATFIVNGFADLNVDTHQAKLLWDALGENGVPRKMWLHQAGHDDPFDVRREQWVGTLTRFFDHYLRGEDNGVDTEPSVTIQNSDGSWTDLSTWPSIGHSATWMWRDGALVPAAGVAVPSPTPIGIVRRDAADAPAPAFEGFVDFWLGEPTESRPYRLTVASEPLAAPVTIRGEPTVTASFRMTGDRYGIVATLVALGPADRIDPEAAIFGTDLVDAATESCWGESTPSDDACYRDAELQMGVTDYGIIATGASGIERESSREESTPVPDGEWTSVTIGLGMVNATVPAGHRLAIVFTSSSLVFSETPSTRTVTIGSDLQIVLPEPAEG